MHGNLPKPVTYLEMYLPVQVFKLQQAYHIKKKLQQNDVW